MQQFMFINSCTVATYRQAHFLASTTRCDTRDVGHDKNRNSCVCRWTHIPVDCPFKQGDISQGRLCSPAQARLIASDVLRWLKSSFWRSSWTKDSIFLYFSWSHQNESHGDDFNINLIIFHAHIWKLDSWAGWWPASQVVGVLGDWNHHSWVAHVFPDLGRLNKGHKGLWFLRVFLSLNRWNRLRSSENCLETCCAQ